MAAGVSLGRPPLGDVQGNPAEVLFLVVIYGRICLNMLKELPDASVIKAFNTNFATTLATKKVAGAHPTTVLLASDDKEAKDKLITALEGSGLSFIDAGLLKRARELEAMGFLQISLAAADKISWTGGFGIFK